MLLTYDKKVNLILWIVLAVLPPCFILPMYFLTSFGLSNCLLVPAIVYLGIAGLAFVQRAGTFDIFQYQLSTWFSAWKKKTYGKQTAGDYHRERVRKRKNHPFPYLPFLSYGLVLLILCIIFAYSV